MEKATREAKARTSWVDPVPEFDEAVQAFVRGVLADDALSGELTAFAERLRPAWETTLLAQKLVQLTMPGVADTYQGTELPDLSLVDPDNRRPVDYEARRAGLADLAAAPAKLRLTAAALRLRRDHPEWFLADATYEPLDAGPRALAFSRSGRVVTVAPTRALTVQRSGWGDDAVSLPDGSWTDRLGGGTCDGDGPAGRPARRRPGTAGARLTVPDRGCPEGSAEPGPRPGSALLSRSTNVTFTRFAPGAGQSA